ncbi:MAG: tetratricopeptide repeat protein [Cyanobacteriota bacterium]|nr:tetratricopeptide repeat protein [Cyanobacteriota bacterium]
MGKLEMGTFEVDWHNCKQSCMGDFVDDLSTVPIAENRRSKPIAIEFPDDALSCLVLGAVRIQLGDLLGGVAYYDRAIDLQPELAIAYNSRGSVRLQLMCDRDAIADYNRAIELEPDNPEFYANRGMALSLSGEMEASIADLQQATLLYKLQGDRGNSRKLEMFISSLRQQYQHRF